MDSLKEWQNSIFLLVIITLDSSGWIRKMEEERTSGQERSQICTRDSSKEGKEMDEGLSGGQMVAGTKETSKMDCKVVKVCCSGMVDTKNMKEHGTMGCLMEGVSNILKMERGMKAVLGRTSLKEMECSTRKTR